MRPSSTSPSWPSSAERGTEMGREPGFTRRIDPIEWWFLAFPARMPAATNLCVEGTGQLDADAVRNAVAVASQACPGTRLVRRGRNWVDSGIAPAVRVVRGRTLEPDAPELRRPLPAGNRPACEVVLFDGAEPAVVFRADHAVMDARGLLWWARDVFRVLRGEAPRGAASTETVLDLDDPFYRRAATSEPEIKVPSLLGLPPRRRYAGSCGGDGRWRARSPRPRRNWLPRSWRSPVTWSLPSAS